MNDSVPMSTSRPYLLRALYQWLVDNDCTPHLLVHVDYPEVKVPAGYAKDGQIVLNVSPNAVRYLEMENAAVSFEGRFGGVPQRLYLPIGSILAIYARENGQGMVFELEQPELFDAPEVAFEEDSDPDDTPEPPRPSGRPSLKVVK